MYSWYSLFYYREYIKKVKIMAEQEQIKQNLQTEQLSSLSEQKV